jgi:hypothetical protein
MYDYRDGSKTRSRHLRRDVRQALGTSSDSLPDILQVLAAARALGALLDNASGGRFGISIHDFNPPSLDVGQGSQSIPVGTAVTYVTEAREAERERVERVRAQLTYERRDALMTEALGVAPGETLKLDDPAVDPAFAALAHQAGRLDGGR